MISKSAFFRSMLQIGRAARSFAEWNWRRGFESNKPRLAKRADNGFEDRKGHQAPITLHVGKIVVSGSESKLQLCFDRSKNFGRIGELTRFELRVKFDAIDA